MGSVRLIPDSPRRLWAWLAALALILPLTSSPARATQVRRLNLEELTGHAAKVFSGRCTEVRVEKDPRLGLDVTRVTVAVERSVKGRPGRSVTFRILGRQDATLPRGGGVAGMPRFGVGEEMVLFLYREGATGLTSPVGFGQGKFLIVKNKRGQRIAVNEFGNRMLFRGLSERAAARLGAERGQWEKDPILPPEALLGMVESLGQ